MNRSALVSSSSALALSVARWSSAPVFIRGLSGAYDPYSQAFVRYASATVVLVALVFLTHRREFLRLLRNPRPVLGIAALNVAQQTFWTMGCYGTRATLAQLITRLSVIFVILFSFFLFREERAVIRSTVYQLGTLLSLVGVAGVLMTNPASLLPVFDGPAVLLLLTALCWGVYIVWAKHIVSDLHPLPMFTVTAILTTFGFALLTVVVGKPASLIEAGPKITAVAFVSGMFPIALAHPCFHFAQKYLGSAFSSSIVLLTPLGTYLLALIFLGERLLPSQWGGAGMLILGTLLVTWAGHRAHRGIRLQPFEP